MRRKGIPLFAALLCLSFLIPAERYFELAKRLEIFAAAFREVNESYIEERNPTQLMKDGIDAMLGSLDPYTQYIPEEDIEAYRTTHTGQYGGIGMLTQTLEKRTLITMLYEGYPAAENGLKIGDEIVEVEGIALSSITAEEATRLMHGQVGTPIRLKVKRAGIAEPLAFSFGRKKIRIRNVPYYDTVYGDVGYIKLANFTSKASEEVKNAMQELIKKGARSIALDLRENPGGLLSEAINICNIFLPKDRLIVTTKGKLKSSNDTYFTRQHPVDTTLRIAVLIDGKSASASEIVAGSLQDYDRAVVIGERSFGKGLVQLSRPLPYNAQLKITTAKYYTPTGRCIQALDYHHKQADGRASVVPDSLRKRFTTPNGRSVYDGGGISPDIAAPPTPPHPFTRLLHEKGFLLAYAAQYAAQHPTLASARAFTLSDREYDAFVTWMSGQQYTYHSPTEQALERFEQAAKSEGFFNGVSPLFTRLQRRAEESKERCLTRYREEIKKALEEHIAPHYYFEKGSIVAQLRNDEALQKAVETLHDAELYKKTLNMP